MATARPVTFLVPGREAPAGTTRGALDEAGGPRGRIKQSVSISSERASGALVPVAAVPGEDVIVLHVDGGPSLILHPEHARDLLLAQSQDGPAANAGAIMVPARLQWRGLEEQAPVRGATRGFLGSVLLKAIDVLTGVGVDKAADLAASVVVRKFDAQVDPGVYALDADSLEPLKGRAPLKAVPPANGASLVLIHGTFSTTSGTFAKLWTHHPERVRSLFSSYSGRVYALDHPTLGATPMANALTLVNALPRGARLHLVTHSRGGLVGEVLARACAGQSDQFKPFSAKAYAAQREELRELTRLTAAKSIAVERIVRVACPARGTLLASKRLDAYLSVLKWALELASVPVAPAFVELLTEVARRRADPAQLPGLAAQMPDSPLVQWLHSLPSPIAGDLRVVAGDMDGDSVVTWLKTLLADAFFWTDNDLVVQTRSMYGGSPRANEASFVLDQGGRVSHFNYFANEHTAAAVVNALTQEHPQAFSAIGPLSWSGESSSGLRGVHDSVSDTPSGRRRRPDLVSDTSPGPRRRPTVVLVPGVFGSHLRSGKTRIWLDRNLPGSLAALEYGRKGIVPDGLVEIYADLAGALSADYDVVEFAYDWRRPIEENARLLGRTIDGILRSRGPSNAPLRIVAHSSGGLVVRAMQFSAPAAWKRFAGAKGARALLLGPPNRGTWLPMQLLSGDDTLGNALTLAAPPFATAEIRQMIASFPGIMQLQADIERPERALAKAATWKRLAQADVEGLERSPWHRLPPQIDAYRWGVPGQSVLDAAVKLRRQLDAQERDLAGGTSGALVTVTGRAPATVDGFEGPGEAVPALVYLGQDGGDGRVALDRAYLEGVPWWSADADHMGLATRRELFPAYLELLDKGTTRLLAEQTEAGARPGSEAPPAVVRTRPSRGAGGGKPPAQPADALQSAAPEQPSAVIDQPALRITVMNGDLTFVPEPLLLGHYRASKLTGTERVMDGLIGGAMDASLRRGLYPVKTGTHQIFFNTRVRPDNPWQLPRPRAVIVVGLGEEGSLRAGGLVETVRQAVIAWAQRAAEERSPTETFSLATTLIGSGGTGVTAAESAQLIARGVREANDRLRGPRVDHLQIIELYGDRAAEAWRALQLLSASSPAAYTVTGPVVRGTGAIRQPLDAGYRGADYDLITAVSLGDETNPAIQFTVDTQRARSEVRAQQTQGPLIRSLVSTASSNLNADPQIGLTLFQLLVPKEIEAFLGGSNDTQLQVDRGTAGIPWELLDVREPGSSDPRPWAVRTKLLRKLRTDVFRDSPLDTGADDGVLVIGDPLVDRSRYPQLAGARREAQAVARVLAGTADARRHVRSVISAIDSASPEPDARTVINAVLERDWRIVHVAGHGEPPERIGDKDANPRGVVLSDGAFLGPREINAMRAVPELVFVNCCHLAARNPAQLLRPDGPNRPEFAAGVAEALIAIGVRCVIAAGWAVDDEPASAFATSFYSALLSGCRFIDAVAQAREAARRRGGNTWAAYQCYGDPDWRYRPETGDAQQPAPPADEFAGVASSTGLILALETLAVRSEYQHADPRKQASKIRYLEATFAPVWGHVGAVAEAFAVAWSRTGEEVRAITWYEKARASADATVTLAGLEQLANLYVRNAWRLVDRGQDHKAAMADLGKARELLDRLLAVDATVERLNLYGSLHKREAMVLAAAGDEAGEIAALSAMRARYRAAHDLAASGGRGSLFYSRMNVLSAEMAVPAAKRGRIKAAEFAAIRKELVETVAVAPDFWSIVGQTELTMYEAASKRRLAAAHDALLGEFTSHHQRVAAPRMWASVYDNATLILRRYALDNPGAERKAADSLLNVLREFTR